MFIGILPVYKTSVQHTLQQRESGKPALQLFLSRKYQRNRPRLGSSNFQLPFYLCGRPNSVQIEMENMDSQSLIRDDLKQYHKKQAIRFLQARNVKVQFLIAKQKKSFDLCQFYEIKNDGSYHFLEVKLRLTDEISNYPSFRFFFTRK